MLSTSTSGLTVALLVAASLVNPNSWEALGEEEGVKVWSRDVPGSSFRELRSVATFDGAAERIWAVISDVEHYADFMPYTREARVLSRSADGFVNYVVTDPPVISRRDIASRHTLVEDRGVGHFRRFFEEANDLAPPLADGVVRMQRMRGYWSVEAIDATHSRVEYVVHTEPGGMVNVDRKMRAKA